MANDLRWVLKADLLLSDNTADALKEHNEKFH